MKVPSTDQSNAIISQYINQMYTCIFGKKMPKAKLRTALSKTLSTEWAYIVFKQYGNNVETLILVLQSENDLGEDCLFVFPYRLEVNKRRVKKELIELISNLEQEFPNIKEMRFSILPDSQLGSDLLRIGFSYDGTALSGSVSRALNSLRDVEQNGIKVKKFNFKRDYCTLDKIKLSSAKHGIRDNRMDYSKKNVRDNFYQFWKECSSKKSTNEAIGIWLEGKLVGAMIMMFVAFDKKTPRLHIGDIVIDIKHRRKGLSKVLYREALRIAEERKIKFFTGVTTTKAVLNAAGSMDRASYQLFYSRKI